MVRPTGEVHPAAAAFPMLPDDELAALADSIAADGLLEPIVLTPDGALLDGRNRMAACRKAKVDPEFVVYDGDPVAFVLARNNQRRHMTKGARAMAGYMAATVGNNYPPSKRDLAAQIGVSDGMVGWAKVVAESTPDAVALVIRDELKLKPAYDNAIEVRQAASSLENRVTRLRQNANDLAAQVEDESLTLSEAEAAWQARRAEHDRYRREGEQAANTMALGHGPTMQAIMLGWEYGAETPLLTDEIIATIESELATIKKMKKELGK